MKDIIFLILALITIGSAIYIAFSKNIVRSVFSLLLTLSSIAGFYVFLSADFLAGIQLLVYVGGILVLLIFAVVLTQGIGQTDNSNPSRSPWISVVILLVFLAVWLFGIWDVNWGSVEGIQKPVTHLIGNNLLTKFLLPFEVISVLLLVGLIGAVAVVRLTLNAQQQSDSSDEPSGE